VRRAPFQEKTIASLYNATLINSEINLSLMIRNQLITVESSIKVLYDRSDESAFFSPDHDVT
jgi:hypothetical protein